MAAKFDVGIEMSNGFNLFKENMWHKVIAFENLLREGISRAAARSQRLPEPVNRVVVVTI